MKKTILLSVLLFGQIVISAMLPDWATGEFKGQVLNWCEQNCDDSDDVGPWYGTAELNIGKDGEISGAIKFGGLKGVPDGVYKVINNNSFITIEAIFNWIENGKIIDVSTSEIVFIKDGANVWLQYFDSDSDGIDCDVCPVEGQLTKVLGPEYSFINDATVYDGVLDNGYGPLVLYKLQPENRIKRRVCRN